VIPHVPGAVPLFVVIIDLALTIWPWLTNYLVMQEQVKEYTVTGREAQLMPLSLWSPPFCSSWQSPSSWSLALFGSLTIPFVQLRKSV
jgi:hypothetical protein